MWTVRACGTAASALSATAEGTAALGADGGMVATLIDMVREEPCHAVAAEAAELFVAIALKTASTELSGDVIM